jgi:hypothetical protein
MHDLGVVVKPGTSSDCWLSERQRAFVPDGAGLVAVAEPAVAPVGGLGTGPERLGDLSPGGAGGQGSGDGQLTFGREGAQLSGEGLDAPQRSRGHGQTLGRIEVSSTFVDDPGELLVSSVAQ